MRTPLVTSHNKLYGKRTQKGRVYTYAQVNHIAVHLKLKTKTTPSYNHGFWETTTQDNADSGVQFITPAGPGRVLLLARTQTSFCEKPYIPQVYVPKSPPQIPQN